MQKQIMETLKIASLLLWILISNIGVAHANNVFKNLTVNEGLAHTDANCVAQDSTGLIWIGTNAGLQKFNGYQLQTIDYYPFIAGRNNICTLIGFIVLFYFEWINFIFQQDFSYFSVFRRILFDLFNLQI